MATNQIILPECLEDFIKFQSCGGDASSSGLYVEMLEGLSMKNVANIASSKYGNADNMLHMALYRSHAKTMKILRSSLEKKGVSEDKVIENINACNFTGTLSAAYNGFRGLRVSKGHIKSKSSFIRVDSVSYKSHQNGEANLEIRDDFDSILFTKKIQLVKDTVIHVEIDKTFASFAVKIGFDQSGIIVYKTDCNRNGSCCASKCGNKNRLLVVDGFDGNVISSHGYGVTACVSLVCCLKDLECKYNNKLSWAILYGMGVFLLEEGIATDRINCFATYGQDWIEAKIPQWQNSMYSALNAEIKNIVADIKKDAYCFPCVSQIGYIPVTS